MYTNRFFALLVFLIILLITFILPMLSAPTLRQFLWSAGIAIAIVIFLYHYHFPVFVPALFFVINFMLWPFQLWLSQTFNLSFPGLLFMASILAYGAIVLAIKKIRTRVTWLKMGNFNRLTIWVSLMLVIVSALALVAWAVLIQKDLSAFKRQLPDWDFGWLLLGGLGFALTNSLVEEFLARALLWDAFSSFFARIRWLNLAQALIFSIWHFRGFPGGIIGMIMVFVWSLALGVIRHHSNGMLAPILAHFCADFTIFVILLSIL